MEKDGVKTFHAKDQKTWRAWLKKNHSKEKSVWLIICKKDSSIPSVYYREAVDEALCFGWIDSKPNKRDEESYFQFFAKRNPKSNWSKINKEKVTKLIKLGKMEKAGLEMVALAKKTGTWDVLNEVEEIVVPVDLQKAFTKNKIAATNFEAFPRSTKKGILDWILNAKRPETRQKRIDETVNLAEKNIRANQYQRK
jgi:uncharacterized protein YdeI (YjbR/CyaY-like superfamily)